jgi:isopenicillin N synthase-like dioxygenase
MVFLAGRIKSKRFPLQGAINHSSANLPRCGSYGCYTLLHASPQRGSLMVYRPKTGEWVAADPIPGHLVINIGEMWEIWTNGLYKSTLHKVIHQGNSYRVS